MNNANVIPLATRYAGVGTRKATETVKKVAPKVKRYAKGLASTAGLLGKAAVVGATEPITNKRLKAQMKQPLVRKVVSPTGKETFVTE